MCQHYVADAMDKDNNQTLVRAHQAQDQALSHPWKAEVDGLKRRQVKTLQKLAVLHQKISKAQGKLVEARQDHAHLVEADNKPHCRLADACEEEPSISTPGPSSFQLHKCPCPLSYPRPTDPSETMEHETISTIHWLLIFVSSSFNILFRQTLLTLPFQIPEPHQLTIPFTNSARTTHVIVEVYTNYQIYKKKKAWPPGPPYIYVYIRLLGTQLQNVHVHTHIGSAVSMPTQRMNLDSKI